MHLAMSERQRKALSYVWLMMALYWFALSINWFGSAEWLHSFLTFCVGVICFAFSERVRT
jgi:hypothetical protein